MGCNRMFRRVAARGRVLVFDFAVSAALCEDQLEFEAVTGTWC
jgi:hypothetical protein